MGESVTTIPPPVPPSEFQATLIQAAESLYQFVLKHRERYLTAWIAETGLRPTQATMVEEHSVEGDTLRAKITIVATDGKPESLLLGQMRRQNEEQAATITALQAELVKHAKVTLVAIEMLSIMERLFAPNSDEKGQAADEALLEETIDKLDAAVQEVARDMIPRAQGQNPRG